MARRSLSKRVAPKGAVSKKVSSGVIGKIRPPEAEEDSPLEVLKAEILQLEAAANAKSVATRAEVGKRLVEVKASLPHGQWLFWVKDNVPLSEATAKRAIQLWHFSKSDPAAFEALRPLGLTKAYKLMTMAPAKRDAFLGKAHDVPGGGVQTPLEMTFEQMMSVLYPPEVPTPIAVTTKLVKGIRRQTLGLWRMVEELWERVPVTGGKAAVEQALGVLAYELDAVVDGLEDKSLIDGTVASFS
ncbi:MAG: DUF3102 domain-containing protein [Polyangiaceae bacterium]